MHPNSKQDVRYTKVIILKKDISEKKLKGAIKYVKSDVEIHKSKNSYHISKKGINKGTALIELSNRLHLAGLKIAVGDADMDVPMFKKVDYSFAPSNASSKAKNAESQVLVGNFEDGIYKIFNLVNNA